MLRLLCYIAHLIDPSFHSCIVPIAKIKINVIFNSSHSTFFSSIMFTGRGSIMAISTSKIRKIIAIIKKCIEKGTRALDLGSNPHSKDEDLFSCGFFFCIRVRLIVANKIEISKASIIIIIFSFKGTNWLEINFTYIIKILITSSVYIDV